MEMKKSSKYTLLVVGFCFCLLIFSRFACDEGFTEVHDLRLRTTELKRIYEHIKEYTDKGGKADLYEAAKNSDGGYAFWVTMLPTRDVKFSSEKRKLIEKEEHLKDRKLFYDVCQYRIIKNDASNWWGIVDLKYGARGKYFLLIDKFGKIHRLAEPILPEQEGAYLMRNNKGGTGNREKTKKTDKNKIE